MKYLSTRGEAAGRSFSEILLEGLAPDGGLYLPERYPQVDAATLARWRQLAYPELAFEILSLFVDDIPPGDLRGAAATDLHRRGLRRPAHRPAPAARARRCSSSACRTVRRWRSRTWRCSSSARPSSTSWRAAAGRLKVLGATSGDTGSAAEHALRGKRGVSVFMLSPAGRMSPFQQAQMFSLQDPNIHNVAVEGVFDDCQDLVKAVSGDLDFKQRQAIGTVNSINWARLLAQVVYYFAGWFQATTGDGEPGRLRRADRQLRQHLRRPHRPADGPADPPAGARHQRERRPRRVLPHRPLPGAHGGRDARDLEPVDGHLQGLELRALRLRRRRPRSGAHPRSVRRGRAAARVHAHGRGAGAAPGLRPGERAQHRRRPAGDDPPGASRRSAR